MEYASFHYLMHKVPDHQKPFYVTGPSPLSFDELYSPRDTRTMILKKEVSYWRTRDRIEYSFYEDRKHKVLIITCYNIDKKESFRTIFVNLESLYYEVESKARDSKELLTSKSSKKLGDDASLHKAVGDYILARLSIKADPLPWPSFDMKDNKINEPIMNTTTTLSTDNKIDEPIMLPTTSLTSADTEEVKIVETLRPLERQCTLEKLASDEYISIEVAIPKASTFVLDIPNVKLHPTIIQIEQQEQQAQPVVDAAKEIQTSSDNTIQTTSNTPAANGDTVNCHDKAKAKPNTKKMNVVVAAVKVATKTAKSVKKVAPSG